MENSSSNLPMPFVDDLDCPRKCQEALANKTEAEIINALVSSGCSNSDPTQLKSKLLKGLIAELCGCYCSGHFPFADPVDFPSEPGKPEAINVPPWAVKHLKSKG